MNTGYEKVPANLQKYVDYIKNTGQVPLREYDFDEDWCPVGPAIREELRKGGFIYMGGNAMQFDCKEGIYLRPDLA